MRGSQTRPRARRRPCLLTLRTLGLGRVPLLCSSRDLASRPSSSIKRSHTTHLSARSSSSSTIKLSGQPLDAQSSRPLTIHASLSSQSSTLFSAPLSHSKDRPQVSSPFTPGESLCPRLSPRFSKTRTYFCNSRESTIKTFAIVDNNIETNRVASVPPGPHLSLLSFVLLSHNQRGRKAQGAKKCL